MRPLELTMQAFETYKDSNTIDFTKLGEQGLYLVTGDTGSGKTTIFDAITYALYGCPSGEVRDSKMLRSTLADENTPTIVRFKFELNNKEYLVTRTIAIRTKRNGDKETKNTVSLELPDDKEVLDQVEKVNRKIEEILGIDSNQFRQIAMIAQGSFQKILTAKSDERQKLFTTLFRTEKYQKIQERISNDFSVCLKEKKNKETILQSHLSNLSFDNDTELNEKLNKVKNQPYPLEDSLKVIEEVIDNDKKALKTLDKEQSEKHNKIVEVNLIVDKVSQLKKDKESLIVKEKELANKEKEAEGKRDTLTVEKDAYTVTVPKFEKDKALIEAELKNYDALDEKNREISDEEKNINDTKRKISNNNVAISKSEEQLKKLEGEKEELKDSAVNVEKILNELKDNKKRKEEVANLSEKASILEMKKKELIKAQEEFKKVNNINSEKQEDFQKKNSLFLQGQAGIMASLLKEGEECPVCGSTHHPKKCEMLSSIPSEAELNKAKKEAEKAQKDAEEKSMFASGLNVEVNSKKEDFAESFSKVIGKEVSDNAITILDEEMNSVKALIEKLEVQYTAEEKKKLRKEELENLIPSLNEKIKELIEKKNNLNSSLVKSETNIQALTKQREALKESLKFDSKKSAESKINEYRGKIDKITKSYEDAVKNVEIINKDIDMRKGEIKVIKTNIEESSVKDVNEEEVNEKFTTLQKEYNGIEDKKKILSGRFKVNEQSYTNIKSILPSYNENEKKYMMLSRLNETMNGGNLNNDAGRIRLETYVQTSYFDKVLHYGNQRLKIMSDGQYEFIRRKTADDRRTQSGLDIDVIDHHSAATRDIKSLSGGESFKASMSLALGLSDEVTQEAGGIKLDTMFIDEGFGTLDNQSMNKAFKALQSVSDGNKLVGIISHVDFLKENIENQLVVTKDKINGSSVVFKHLGD